MDNLSITRVIERVYPSVYVENMHFISHGPSLQLAEKMDENERFQDLRRLILQN